ncbi:hypothetical protein RB595_008687 [Gaeumannomyces hyphopodioides]
MSFSGPAVAGIGLGCAILAAIIATCVVFVIVRTHYVTTVDWLYGRGAPGPEPSPYSHEDAALCVAKIERLFVPDLITSDLESMVTSLKCAISRLVCSYDVGYCDLGSDTSLFDAVAGPHQDWAIILNRDSSSNRQCAALQHLVARILHPRMVPEGDAAITLLPPDIFSVYQKMMARDPTRLSNKWPGETYWSDENFAGVMRHAWRAVSCHFMTSPPSPYRQAEAFADDDPRMKNVLATEQLLKDVLGHFSLCFSENHGTIDEHVRDVTWTAAKVAFLAFSSPKPVELFWTASGRPETNAPNNDELILICFGVRIRNRIPGTQRIKEGRLEMEDLFWEIVRHPEDNETEYRRFQRWERLENITERQGGSLWATRAYEGLNGLVPGSAGRVDLDRL